MWRSVVFRAVDPDVALRQTGPEGVWRENGPVLEITGSAVALLAAERTALNFLQQLSGVATLTARCVRAVEGTGARILDTRKTVPGLRLLQKQAVLAGGGLNHRIGLYDAILIKENHAAMAGGVAAAVRRARVHAPELPLEVECGTLDEVDEALEAAAQAGGLGWLPDPARQHEPRAAARGRGTGRRPRGARGQRRLHAGDDPGGRRDRRRLHLGRCADAQRPRPGSLAPTRTAAMNLPMLGQAETTSPRR